VLAALALPSLMVVSDCAALGVDGWIEKVTALAVEERLLVQVREKARNFQQVQHILSRALARTEPFGARIVVNSDCGSFPQCSGVHLTSKALMAATERPRAVLVGASCHDERELDHAAEIDVDYVVVGPVKATASHPGATPLGWKRFAELALDRPMPVYAIGGLTRGDFPEARRNGAHGVALLSGAFAQ
jgi:8-oxo-dGTP diphosphatase